MSEFFVGQKVVCVDNAARPGKFWVGTIPTLHAVYTVISLKWDDQDGLILDLKEIRSGHRRGDGYMATRFRPLEYKAMSIFRAIAANPKIKIRESA